MAFQKLSLVKLAFLAAASLMMASAPSQAEIVDNETWQGIRKDAFPGRTEFLDGTGIMTMDAPVRAEDASLVPITVHMPADFAPKVKSLTLVVDKNPAPVAGKFTYGEAAGKAERMLAVRIRVDQYSDIRAIAETSDGKLYMISKYVKASGGCSAPASSDAEEAAKTMGKMLIKTALNKSSNGSTQEGQLMIKHPNNSGLQMDQLTGLYAKAHYVDKIEVTNNGKLVFAVETGISISENPNLRFTYEGKASDLLEVKAEDSEGKLYAGKSATSAS